MKRTEQEINQAREFGSVLRKVRATLRIKLGAIVPGQMFAEVLRVSKSTYYALENGTGKPLSAIQLKSLLEKVKELDPEAKDELESAHNKIYSSNPTGPSLLSRMLTTRQSSAQRELVSELISNGLDRGVQLLQANRLRDALRVTRAISASTEQAFPNHPDQVKLVLFNARIISALGSHFEAQSLLQHWLSANKDHAPQQHVCEVILSKASIANRLHQRNGLESASSFYRVSQYVAAKCSDDDFRKDEDWNWVRNNALRSSIISITDQAENIDLDQLAFLYKEFDKASQTELREYGEHVNTLVRARYFACTGQLDQAWSILDEHQDSETNLPDSPLHRKTAVLLKLWSGDYEGAMKMADKWARTLSESSSRYAAGQFYSLSNIAKRRL